MFGQTGQPVVKPQGGFTFGSGSTSSGAIPGNSAFAFGSPSVGSGSTTSTTSGFILGNTSTAASSVPASKPFYFGSGASITTPSFSLGGLSGGPTTATAASAPAPNISIGSTPSQKAGGLFGSVPSASTNTASALSTGGFTFGGSGTSSVQGSSAATTSTTGISSTPSMFTSAPQATATAPSLGLAISTASSGQGFKLGTASTAATGLGSTQASGGLGFGLAKTSNTLAGTTSTTLGIASTGAGTGTALPSFGAHSTSKAATSVLPTAQTTASTAGITTSSTPQLSYKQLEEHINKWVSDLEDHERTFLDQAAQVNAWDRLLIDNGEKITELNDNVESVKAEQKRLDEELDFILAQQQELKVLLKPLEEELQKRITGPGQLQNADREREFTYGLAKDVDGQLKQMVGDLKSIIEHLNKAGSTQQENNDPIIQVAKILNAHMNSLQWIDQNAALLQRKVDEVSSLSEIRRKEQERDFRLAFD
uniref:Nuclear pore glycoprotein p62-like isoform X1 n=1 Tax=Actinia tenebrosa TaxID=6105 RepID=A0A6P8I079_ACTTE